MERGESDEALASRVLGGVPQRETIPGTKNEVSSWSSGGRRIVIKRWLGEAGDACAKTESAVYDLLSHDQLSPPLIERGQRHIVLEWIAARPVLDEIPPSRWRESRSLQQRFITAIARFHDAIAPLATAGTPGPIPGPTCAIHGDALPHNVLIAEDGSVRLIDFEGVGTGPAYLDLVPLLCVLPAVEATALVVEYHRLRGTAMDAESLRVILRRYPSLRLARLHGQRSIFREDEGRFRKMIDWFEAGARQAASEA